VKATSLLLIVLGLLLGPGYAAYCEYLSGRDSASFDLDGRADRWTLPDGSIQRFRSGLAYRPQPLDLHPERNRVRLTLVFDPPAENAATTTNEYQTTLFYDEHPLLQSTLHVELRPGTSAAKRAGTLSVYAPGEHLFVLEELGVPASIPSRVTLTVRESVEQPLKLLVWAGLVLLLTGIGLLAYALIAPGP
jgi:hypothetical protein